MSPYKLTNEGMKGRMNEKSRTNVKTRFNRAPVAQLDEHRVVIREVVSSTRAGPTLRVFK